MNKKQLIVVLSGCVLLLTLFFFGKTKSSKPKEASTNTSEQVANKAISSIDLINTAKQKLSATQQQYVTALENNITNASANNDKIKYNTQLAGFWKDSLQMFEPYCYYTAEAAKLDNSEKSLTFAARLFVQSLFDEQEPAMQKWLATNGKDLLDKALAINPNNDSTKIGLAACYILGNISDNPMQGISMVKPIVDKNPNNIYAQWVLALGGKRSGQYAKAIERFLIILKNNPNSLPAMLHLAECYDMNGEKQNAIQWYKTVQTAFPNEQARKELQNRIEELSK